jgi:cell division protein ZapA
MSTGRTVVKVKIGSEEYSLRSDRSEDYTRSVAQHVDRALRDVLGAGAIVESQKAAILAALAIADELFQARQTQTELGERLERLTQELSRLLPPAKRASRSTGAFASPGGGA